MSGLPRGYAELERKDRRMFRRLIDTAVFAGDHLADAHDWVREVPEDEPDAAPPVGMPHVPDLFNENGPMADLPRQALAFPDAGRAADPFVPAASAPHLRAVPASTTLAMRIAVTAALIAVAAAIVATVF